MNPRVSILLPNLNNKRFLEERLKSIADQTFSDWELVIVDNYSDDGAWELFQEWAQDDNRIRISQAARNGMYANWNNCINLAKGKYIYIATSDDTMTSDCLEKMYHMLERHPDCSIAHCCLNITDENGKVMEGRWENYMPQLFYKDLLHKPHIRKAPLDGILHFALGTVYTSITQLLIRRKVFDTIGLFKQKWGSAGDFEWEMRASLIFSTVHIPEYLATWRKHDGQATVNPSSIHNRIKLMEMAQEAVGVLEKHNNKLYCIFQKDLNKLLSQYRADIIRYRLLRKSDNKSDVTLLNLLIDLIRHPVIFSGIFISLMTKSNRKKDKISFLRKYISSLPLDVSAIELK